MSDFKLPGKLLLATVYSAYFMTSSAFAEGGVSIQGTRIIYPQGSRQEAISLRNSSDDDSFLIQSWVENSKGENTRDFIVTPPLYLSGPRNENVLRLILSTSELPDDKESLYYFIAKAIPSIDSKKNEDKSVIRIAAASRIKIFYRPKNLQPPPENAPSQLRFKNSGNQIEIFNPTPYYITMTDIKYGKTPLSGVMISPQDKTLMNRNKEKRNTITFSTINDSGAITKPITVTLD